MSVRIIKQKHEQRKNSVNGEAISSPPVLIESMLFLMPDQSQAPIVAYEQPRPSLTLSTALHDMDANRALALLGRSSATPSNSQTNRQPPVVTRVPVPVHNASQWFSGPDLQNERNGRMEKVVASLVRRPLRTFGIYGYVYYRQRSIDRSDWYVVRISRAPTLSSPSSKDHAYYRGESLMRVSATHGQSSSCFI